MTWGALAIKEKLKLLSLLYLCYYHDKAAYQSFLVPIQVFVDDINMPDEDQVRSQPPIELLRQLIDHQVMKSCDVIGTFKDYNNLKTR